MAVLNSTPYFVIASDPNESCNVSMITSLTAQMRSFNRDIFALTELFMSSLGIITNLLISLSFKHIYALQSNIISDICVILWYIVRYGT